MLTAVLQVISEEKLKQLAKEKDANLLKEVTKTLRTNFAS